ncbi:MAG: hypothetical protein SOW08_04300 [Lachnospiraceae bacterium]|nr:hypothetical protein [Lachnospiraceae bacterium]
MVLEMGSSIGKQVYFALNKVDAEKEKMMRELIKNPDGVIVAVPSGQEILSKGLKGEKMDCEVQEIKEIIKILEGE